MTMNQDEAIARSCGCGEFDQPAYFWDDLTADERFAIGKAEAADREAVANWAAKRLDAVNNPDSEWVLCGSGVVRKGRFEVWHNGELMYSPDVQEEA